MNPTPKKSPVAYVHPSKYVDYQLNPDLPMGERCLKLLKQAGFNATPNSSFDWIHDTYLILIRMFPDGCPPSTIISMNARYDPHFHIKVGTALRPLRAIVEKTLFIGTGGAVHNLYRNSWGQMLLYRDNFAMTEAPEACMLDFRQEFADAIMENKGPMLRRAMSNLMKLDGYRDAHGTDDHFMPALFVAGLCGAREDADDERMIVKLGAEDWELRNMCNSQYTLGTW